MQSKGQRLGYIRVSSDDQNTDRQLECIDLDKKFTDKASGKNTDRPQLDALLQFAREGDLVIVHSMDRLARCLQDLLKLVSDFTRRGIQVQFIKENLIFTGEDEPMANLMMGIIGSVAQFERAMIRERQREGIALAKKRGAYQGRKKTLTPEMVLKLRQRADDGEKKSQLAREFNISRETVYQYLKLEIKTLYPTMPTCQ